MADDGWLKAALRVRAERIEAVRALHQPHTCTGYPDCMILFGGECAHDGHCNHCRKTWPCPTICALDGGDRR